MNLKIGREQVKIYLISVMKLAVALHICAPIAMDFIEPLWIDQMV